MDKKFTVPNIVTAIGIIAIPIYIFAYLNQKSAILFIALLIIGMSDLLDGFSARKLGQETKFGELLDRLRDRFFQIAVIGNLIWLGHWYSIYGAMLIITIEVSVIMAPFLFSFFLKKNQSHLLLKIKQGSYIASIFYLYRAALFI